VHVDEPAADPLLLGHKEHVLLPAMGEYCPLAHGVQEMRPALLPCEKPARQRQAPDASGNALGSVHVLIEGATVGIIVGESSQEKALEGPTFVKPALHTQVDDPTPALELRGQVKQPVPDSTILSKL